jgi:hypothetical protein
MNDSDLERMERSTYRAAADSGLWDLFLASIVAMFALAPLLSVPLGDFWASAVFLPVFAVILLAIRIVNVRVIAPRVGVVEFARPRRQRLMLLATVMLVVNVAALIAGIVVAVREPVMQGPIVPLMLSLIVLFGFSVAAFVLQIPRVFLYGLLLAVAPMVGEALFLRGYASHHGFPVVFGVSAVVIAVGGLLRFVRFLPPDQAALPVEEGSDE